MRIRARARALTDAVAWVSLDEFISDNTAPMTAEALEALREANDGPASAYGHDGFTAALERRFVSLFGEGTRTFLMATGTAANGMAVASVTEPWERLVFHAYAHWYRGASTAPERLTGCRMVPVMPRVDLSRLDEDDLREQLQRSSDPHDPQPGVVLLSNPTELGTVYRPDQLVRICSLAHQHGFRVHVDGARFHQAVSFVRTLRGCDQATACRALTVDAGIDTLVIGGTKMGLAFGEAVLFFTQHSAAAARGAERFVAASKSMGHLISKQRFVAAQFERVVETGAWLRYAEHAARAGTRARGEALGAWPSRAVPGRGQPRVRRCREDPRRATDGARVRPRADLDGDRLGGALRL